MTAPAPVPALHRPLHAISLPVMGIPTRFESTSPAVIEVAREAFGAWEALEPRWWGGAPGVVVRVDVVPGGEGPGEHAPLRFRYLDADTVEFATPGSRARADARTRTATARVTEALVGDRQHFRHSFLEALVLALLTRLDREPLHAAALVRGTSALLLAAPSGTGKSTLVYAAARTGFQVLAEDAVYLQQRPFRVWGIPAFVHLSPESLAFFPELNGRAPALRANGKTRVALDLREMGAAAAQPVVERAGVCLLAREGGPARLEPHAQDEVVRALTSRLEQGFDCFAGSIGERVRALATRGGWRLHLPPHPADALPFLHQMFDALERA